MRPLKLFLILLFGYFNSIFTQELAVRNETDISMFLKKDSIYIKEIESDSGDLWNELGHHGPAIENLWAGYRIYFDKKAAIDLYSKITPQLELKKTKWYTSDSLLNAGFGSDYYWVGNSIGAGSIRLWESDSVKMLNPVKRRRAVLVREGSISQINLFSEGILYNDDEIDIIIKITVFSGYRYTKVETFVLSDKPVQLVTGLNYNPNLKVKQNENNIISWGKHKTDVKVGAAVIFKKDDFEKNITTKDEYLFISKPTKYLSSWITTASELEKDINNYKRFEEYVVRLTDNLLK